jgi:tetratricopeptide (TPR) repeat protein
MFRLISYQTILLSVLVLVLTGCNKDDPDRHLELGKWYNNKGLYDEAIAEYREVIRLYPPSIQNLSREEYKSLTAAHYNLALMYTKKGWWDFALDAAESSFQLQPNTDTHDLIRLIRKQIMLSNNTEPS